MAQKTNPRRSGGLREKIKVSFSSFHLFSSWWLSFSLPFFELGQDTYLFLFAEK